VEVLRDGNKNVARLINDLGEILMREDMNMYIQWVNEFCTENVEHYADEKLEREFLKDVYSKLMHKLHQLID